MATSISGAAKGGLGKALKGFLELFTTNKIAEKIGDSPFQDAVDMIEQGNLFAVALGAITNKEGEIMEGSSRYYEDAIAFQETLHSKLKTNIAEMQQYQGMFYNMFKAQMGDIDITPYIDKHQLQDIAGYTRDVDVSLSEFLSEQVSKMAVDMSSLFNTTQQEMARRLQSGLSGQTQTLRGHGLGIDITLASLQTTADQLGIEKSVSQMSYAEKELLRYISIVNQAGVAQGDFARTMDQPANQMRIFQNNVKELRQAFGGLFVEIANRIFPIVNGVVSAVATILKALGAIFGFKFSTGAEEVKGSINSAAEGANNLASGMGGAAKSAAEFKKQLMGFDEINNIEPPSAGGGGGRRRSAAVAEIFFQ